MGLSQLCCFPHYVFLHHSDLTILNSDSHINSSDVWAGLKLIPPCMKCKRSPICNAKPINMFIRNKSNFLLQFHKINLITNHSNHSKSVGWCDDK